MPSAHLLSDVAAALDRSLPIPVATQLRGLIEYGIACGELPAGARLPSVRELAMAGGLAPMTVVSVYRDLRERGLVDARAGSGTYVASQRPEGRTVVANICAHLDAALSEADSAGIAPAEVASLLNARIGRGRAREGRRLTIVMAGVFETATRAYAQEIARHLRPGDRVEAMTLEAMRRAPPAADLVVTFANRRTEVEALLGGRAPVATVNFIPSERTRTLLAAIDPLARVGIVSLFPEFLPLMKPGVQRFAPHVASVEATVLSDPKLAELLERVDVVVYATGAEDVRNRVSSHVATIEYRHAPDPLSVQTVLLPQIERIRNG
ncbi:GntR family transcriptional regulator [Alsobacter sp. SYSU M60028]|uniref:GntR family transcriptional regulator n=1 Tax=Alsobacter ponti TaxID=2962936 RepID=A0ABT1LD89_9HYPH|nr:GntR family transcriptional regulator [Alsobacter ponti]MCP8939424.1 GntR family transcriptional regulator [Alsobacter ponti]